MNWKVRQRNANSPPKFRIAPKLLWTDPPYGTGKKQSQKGKSFIDPQNTDYVCESLIAWIPVMDSEGTICVCCDYCLAPVLTKEIAKAGWVYRGSIIWEFGLGRPRTTWWPVRHNDILTFFQNENSGIFHSEAIPRIKRLAPKAGYSEDKPSGSVWEYTLSNTAPERVGYPNQKPLSIIEPFILAHTNPGDLVADPFCGSSSTGVAALTHGRRYYGTDISPDALAISNERFKKWAK